MSIYRIEIVVETDRDILNIIKDIDFLFNDNVEKRRIGVNRLDAWPYEQEAT